jgi:hypothetical protein
MSSSLPWNLIIPQSHKLCMPQPFLSRPFEKLNRLNEMRLEPPAMLRVFFVSSSPERPHGTRSGQNAWRRVAAGCPSLPFWSMTICERPTASMGEKRKTTPCSRKSISGMTPRRARSPLQACQQFENPETKRRFRGQCCGKKPARR